MTAGRDSSIVERFEVAGPRELRALFASASADEKRDLRTYLGGERFRRLSLAAAASRGGGTESGHAQERDLDGGRSPGPDGLGIGRPPRG